MGLLVFPCGTRSTCGKMWLSAFVEIRRRDDWLEDWKFPDVEYRIELKNAGGKADLIKTETHTFHPEHADHGWHDMVKCSSYAELQKKGWVFPDNTVRFTFAVGGVSLGHSKRRPQETDHGSRMWHEMKFADMHICSGDDGPELPCHRAVLAVASPVFAAMLASEMKEGVERRLLLPHASASTLKFLLECVYTRCLPEEAMFDLQSLAELLRLAHQYELAELCRQCASNLVEMMHPENVCDIIGLLGALRTQPSIDEQFQKAKQKAHDNSAMFDQLVLGHAAGKV